MSEGRSRLKVLIRVEKVRKRALGKEFELGLGLGLGSRVTVRVQAVGFRTSVRYSFVGANNFQLTPLTIVVALFFVFALVYWHTFP